MRYLFEDFTFDTERRELHRGTDVVSITPQVFDLLVYLIRNRERVASKDDLISADERSKKPRLGSRYLRVHLIDLLEPFFLLSRR